MMLQKLVAKNLITIVVFHHKHELQMYFKVLIWKLTKWSSFFYHHTAALRFEHYFRLANPDFYSSSLYCNGITWFTIETTSDVVHD